MYYLKLKNRKIIDRCFNSDDNFLPEKDYTIVTEEQFDKSFRFQEFNKEKNEFLDEIVIKKNENYPSEEEIAIGKILLNQVKQDKILKKLEEGQEFIISNTVGGR